MYYKSYQKFANNSEFHFQKNASKTMKFRKRYDHLRKKIIFHVLTSTQLLTLVSVILNWCRSQFPRSFPNIGSTRAFVQHKIFFPTVYLIGQNFGGQNFRRTKFFGGQYFRHQVEISAVLSDEIFSSVSYFLYTLQEKNVF